MAAIRVTHLAGVQVFADTTARDTFETTWENGDMCVVLDTGLCIRLNGAWEVIALVSDLS
jgi:hypothetical protein